MYKTLKIKRSLAHRNIFNTNYKAWYIQLEIPKVGHSINEWLWKHNLAGFRYVEECNYVSYCRRWYRKLYWEKERNL